MRAKKEERYLEESKSKWGYVLPMREEGKKMCWHVSTSFFKKKEAISCLSTSHIHSFDGSLDIAQNVAKKNFIFLSSLFDKRDTEGGYRNLLDGI